MVQLDWHTFSALCLDMHWNLSELSGFAAFDRASWASSNSIAKLKDLESFDVGPETNSAVLAARAAFADAVRGAFHCPCHVA